MRHPYSQIVVAAVGMIALICVTLAQAAENNDEFPGRKVYPDVPYISVKDFYQKVKDNKVLIVDVRSPFEFQTLQISGATNVPLATKNFVEKVQELRESSDLLIAMYCNGITCMKSYQAAQKSLVKGIQDVVAFDAGIMRFAKKHPTNVKLLGKNLGDAKKLISVEKFKDHLISPDEFGERVAETSDIVLDVRDRFQREGLSVFVGRESRVSLDNKKRLDRFINKAKSKNKALLIYDQSGRQVRWLQYYLEAKGISSYYFMRGGMHAYYEAIQSQ